MVTEKMPKNAVFVCEKCDFSCSKPSNWNIHIMTSKHKQVTVCDSLVTTKKLASYICGNCNKEYNSRNGLWVHSKKCNNVEEKETTDTSIILQLMKQNDEFKNIILQQNKLFVGQSIEMQKQNQDLQKQILDICKNGIINNSITNNNSNNKTFNLNLFLYEDCKDAMNLSEFLESIKIQLADVEAVGELGYINGISKLIIENLKGLDVTKRPIHCSDEKREIIYIKEAGVWTKDEDCSKLRRLIKTVSNRNFKHTRLYKEKYPDCVHADSKYSDRYVKIVLEATGGGSKFNDYESENKIMKKIAKEITIDKSNFEKR
jgi:hypothetical protein